MTLTRPAGALEYQLLSLARKIGKKKIENKQQKKGKVDRLMASKSVK
jgi:hypothetical protein